MDKVIVVLTILFFFGGALLVSLEETSYEDYDQVSFFNNAPRSILDGKTLEEVFSVDYKTTDINNLNNQSLNDVFLDGNLISVELEDYYSQPIGATRSYVEDYGIISSTSNGTYAYQIVNFIDGHKYYNNATAKNILPLGNHTFLWRIQNSNVLGFYFSSLPNAYQWNTVSGISLATSSGNGQVRYQTSLGSVVYNEYYFKKAYFIDITILGIDTLSLSEMDDYYDAFISEDILLEAFNGYNDLSLTQEQLDYLYAQYLAHEDDETIPIYLLDIDMMNDFGLDLDNGLDNVLNSIKAFAFIGNNVILGITRLFGEDENDDPVWWSWFADLNLGW